jgi:hypothetical protein
MWHQMMIGIIPVEPVISPEYDIAFSDSGARIAVLEVTRIDDWHISIEPVISPHLE